MYPYAKACFGWIILIKRSTFRKELLSILLFIFQLYLHFLEDATANHPLPPLSIICVIFSPTNYLSYAFYRFKKTQCSSFSTSPYFSSSILKVNMASLVLFLGMKPYCSSQIITSLFFASSRPSHVFIVWLSSIPLQLLQHVH